MTATDVAMNPARVVRAYLVISGLFTLSASVIWAVNTLFLLDSGLNIFQVFIANSAFTVGTVLFEIPTGVVADTAGRRRSFLLSTVTLMVGTLAYVAISIWGGGLLLFSQAERLPIVTQAQRAVEHHSQRRSTPVDARIQSRVVPLDGAGADHDGVMLVAQPMGVHPRRL